MMSNVYRVPLVMTPQDEGGYTVTSPVLPGLVTEGDSLEEALTNVEDALGPRWSCTRTSAGRSRGGWCKTPMPARSSSTCCCRPRDLS